MNLAFHLGRNGEESSETEGNVCEGGALQRSGD